METPEYMALDKENNFLYICDLVLNEVFKCSITESGSLTSCGNSTATDLTSPYDIALDNVSKSAYITSFQGDMIKCTVDIDGDLINCTQLNVPGEPVVIAIDSVSRRAYYSDYSSASVYKCDTENNGNLSNCAVTAAGTTFQRPEYIALDTTSNVAYVAEFAVNETSLQAAIYTCRINPSNGELENCKTTANDYEFFGIRGIALNILGQKAYINQLPARNVTSCDIVNGELENCAPGPNVGLMFPVGIELYD